MGKGGYSKLKRKWLNTIIGIIVCTVFGGIMGVLIANYFEPWLQSDSIFIELLKFYGLFILIIIGYMVQIIIHEAGHLIFGLLTGYTFVSFRIGSLTIIKEDGKLKTNLIYQVQQGSVL